MEDCIFFDEGKDPYIDQINPKNLSISYGMDENGQPVIRRVGAFSTTLNGKNAKYLYISEYPEPPSNATLKAYIDKLKPKPYCED